MADLPPLVDLAREARRVAEWADVVQGDRDERYEDSVAAFRVTSLKSQLSTLIAVAQRAMEDL